MLTETLLCPGSHSRPPISKGCWNYKEYNREKIGCPHPTFRNFVETREVREWWFLWTLTALVQPTMLLARVVYGVKRLWLEFKSWLLRGLALSPGTICPRSWTFRFFICKRVVIMFIECLLCARQSCEVGIVIIVLILQMTILRHGVLGMCPGSPSQKLIELEFEPRHWVDFTVLPFRAVVRINCLIHGKCLKQYKRLISTQ